MIVTYLNTVLRRSNVSPSIGKVWEAELFYDWELWLDEVWEDQV
jgi:hypothetical protein